MTKKTLMALGVPLLMILILGFTQAQRNTGPVIDTDRITSVNYGRIRHGMTERQVYQILGRSADREYHPWEIVLSLKPLPGTDPEWEKMWIGKDMMAIIIHFDQQGRVCNKAYLKLSQE